MVLNTRNKGKWFSKEWLRERNRAVEDKTGFTDEELAYYEVTGSQGGGETNPDTYKVDNVPLDPRTEPKSNARDIRDDPRKGG